MPKAMEGKSKKKASSRKPVRKALKKKAAKKKITKKIKTTKKKAQKKTVKKPARKKTAAKAKSGVTPVLEAKPTMIEPGPPPRVIPPVEEPASSEEAIGTVTHYYSHLSVAVIQINKGTLKTGDTIHVKGHVSDFTQAVESMEYEHQHVDAASAGQSVGLKVKDHAREHDIVFRVK